MAWCVDEKKTWPGGVFPRHLRSLWGISVLACCTLAHSGATAADVADAEELYRTGHYTDCAKLAAEELRKGGQGERWHALIIKSLLARGQAEEAVAALEDALRQYPLSAVLHLLGRDVYRSSGREREAVAELNAIEALVREAPERYGSAENRLALGRIFLLRGADARKVLDQFYDVVMKQRPDQVEVYLATAELALDKQDYALAAETLHKAPKEAAVEPRFHYLLACAFSNDDRARSAKALADALAINPHHADSLLLQADHLIDAEKYAEAETVLQRVTAENSWEPRAWAYQAVLAHLRNDRDGESLARQRALAQWASNPEVDHIIGRKLAQKYRFAEGSAYQTRALALDPEYQPAKVQLCQDLLRLGEEEEGWKLADHVFARDGYNVVAYNLITLRDRLAGFRTLKDDGFLVRMEPREADLYGQRALSLLHRARKTLCEKYGISLSDPVIVEIFPQKKDFAVRTFGLPGADGLLGVCFGRVITAASPASGGDHHTNWESVLWHEFCHVVTLNKTKNTMPRWLSEGISVYEEERQDPAWGSYLNPRFRAMILGDAFVPLSRLSSAFLAPESPLHLQFAYFESALAVEFLVAQGGLPALKSLLDDLGAGSSINDALPRRTKMSLEQLDRAFGEFARKRASGVGPDATWEEPELPGDADSAAVKAWLEKHPKSFWGWQRLGSRLVHEEKWQEAKVALETFRQLFPEYVGSENAYVLLASVARHLSDPAGEHAILETLALRDGSAGAAYLRLMELDEAAGDWRGLAKNARRMLAVNPLVPSPHRQLARAAEHLGERDEAITAYRALALLDDSDPAELHFRLARLLREAGKTAEARREVLKSLEEAPRFLDSHRLLLELVDGDKPAASARPERPLPESRRP
jgi:tetratricopeptide (TPR) repeat protein